MNSEGLIGFEVKTTFIAEIVFNLAIGFTLGRFPACFH
jgi:hypothetical protein